MLQRPYHKVALIDIAKSQRTHVETCGQVVYRRKMVDGDWHITLAIGINKIVVEIIPSIPLIPPTKNTWIIVQGIRRYDEAHNWPEIHPVERWIPAKIGCK